MSYKAIARAAEDIQLNKRIIACVATQSGYTLPEGVFHAPEFIANYFKWAICAQPGWGEAYEYAWLNNVENPGDDEAVISDAMILSAVQTVLEII